MGGKKNPDFFFVTFFLGFYIIASICFYFVMLFYYTFTLFHYNKAQVILLAVGFDDIRICDVWMCAQPSQDLESEVQQL